MHPPMPIPGFLSVCRSTCLLFPALYWAIERGGTCPESPQVSEGRGHWTGTQRGGECGGTAREELGGLTAHFPTHLHTAALSKHKEKWQGLPGKRCLTCARGMVRYRVGKRHSRRARPGQEIPDKRQEMTTTIWTCISAPKPQSLLSPLCLLFPRPTPRTGKGGDTQHGKTLQ